MNRSRRYVIVGNGVAGATAALALRARDERATITLVSNESPYFFSRTAMMYAFMNKLSRRAMEPFSRETWRERGITRVTDSVTDLDAVSRTITTARGETLTYDSLIVATGSAPRSLTVDGLTEDTLGTVHFVSLRDLDACEHWAQSTRHAVVVGGGLIGIELVECLIHHGIKTTFFVRDPWYWPAVLCHEESELVTKQIRSKGVDVRYGVSLAGVDHGSSGRVSSVRASDGETVIAQMLGVAVGVVPCVAWLRSVATPPVLGRGVVVDATLKTSLECVWAAGDCAELGDHGLPGVIEQSWYAAKRQGELVARNASVVNEKPETYRPSMFVNAAKLFDLEFTTVGDLGAVGERTMSVFRSHPTRAITQRIVHHDGRVRGFNLIGSRWNTGILSRWITEERPLEWVLGHLRDAQFDVELGRADLARMNERELAVTAKCSESVA